MLAAEKRSRLVAQHKALIRELRETSGRARIVAALSFLDQAFDRLAVNRGSMDGAIANRLALLGSIVARWIDDYNTERPHSSLGYATPAAFAAGPEQQRAGSTAPAASPALLRDDTGRYPVAAG